MAEGNAEGCKMAMWCLWNRRWQKFNQP